MTSPEIVRLSFHHLMIDLRRAAPPMRAATSATRSRPGRRRGRGTLDRVPSPARLETIRRAKWVVGLLVLVLVSGGLGHLVGHRGARPDGEPSPAEPSTTESAARERGASPSPEAGAPPPAASERPPPKPTDPLLLRVIGASGPEAGVFVRVIDDDRAKESHRTCSSLARTDEHGLATVAVERE